MAISTHVTVDDLPSSQREALEILLGQKLETEQHLFILACTPGVVPEEGARRAACDKIEETLSLAHEHSTAQGATLERADAAVLEAMEATRRRG